MTDQEIAIEVIEQLEKLLDIPDFQFGQRGQAENIVFRAIKKAKVEQSENHIARANRNPFTGE